MRVVVTGREGQVVQSLLTRAARHPEIDIVPLGRPDLDLTDLGRIAPAIADARPDILISAAAYTSVDKAEDEPGLAYRVNAEAPAELARAARLVGAPIIHLSTDYVFDGASERPYRENDPTSPISTYGRSKLAGEVAVRAAQPDHLILRTAWVYSPFGRNFVKSMLRSAQISERVAVVDDQHGNPTSAFDVTDALLLIVDRWRQGGDRAMGTYHFAGTGETTWCGLAHETFSISRRLGGPFVEVDAITTAEFAAKAARPVNSSLDCGRFADAFGHRAPAWQSSLAVVVRSLLQPR
ncbi:MAG: dTDP-4-dehydrorhamnose reductase [Devosia nanyangense]|uniref:dTDP-4-dehydrorhamnose reductase n=1 Tax=Devosia nanyangense TaxID=1228055 RepID=A0A933NXX1_9HYPH|nr:dTDP-4-dehydrorhamnose reductase [Devosia nanyangense]